MLKLDGVCFDAERGCFCGPGGTLVVPDGDPAVRKLMMLVAGQCAGRGPGRAAREAGFSRSRYFQVREVFGREGMAGLANRRRGPKRNYRRTPEAVCQVIRHRFLDPDASSDVVAQKLRQSGMKISTRSVDRVYAKYGLQKKTLPM